MSYPVVFGLLLAAALALPLHASAGTHSQTRKKAAPAAAQKAKKSAIKKTSVRKVRSAPASRQGLPYADHPEAMRFADEVAERRGLDPAWTRRAIGQAQQLPLVQRLMQPAQPGTRKNWAIYRSRFIDNFRINAGLRFWQENESWLAKAEREHGVPAEIIAGIIGVETIYGRQMGDFRVIDALSTLAFNHPENHPRAAERAAYFRGELEQFLSTQHRRSLDPLEPLGSFAGATGMPQFMPSSWVKWAVDFDGDGRIDLRNSAADAIGSVANYLKGYGWQTGMPTHYPVRFDAETVDMDTLLAPDILPTFSAASFQAKGALLDGAAAGHAGPLALVELENGDGPSSYVAGTENFYVVTRYNHSSYYAMAVIELGRAVREAVERQP
ncbi:lytic murein transglycosylase B [Ramlibacter sp. AW1]|uniref:Lytic murein transglycosylase B n=1 Tax=Ramlibacter aurantiacus TaxID=2801330 RepID=A0A936ZLP4_9BURK|nr:lytic murein transglycosylase B [Ramlibacter aurantiacus]MBL0423177.1 lytic murein transglycosylase B [Ramlibacter aurantiacus]